VERVERVEGGVYRNDPKKEDKTVKENEIIADIKDYLKTVDNCFFWKEHGGQFGQAGIPDIIVCLNGRFIALEVKTEKGKITVLQEVTLRKIRKAGGTAEVVRSVADVKAILTKLR
jgi:mevalonate kinase